MLVCVCEENLLKTWMKVVKMSFRKLSFYIATRSHLHNRKLSQRERKFSLATFFLWGKTCRVDVSVASQCEFHVGRRKNVASLALSLLLSFSSSGMCSGTLYTKSTLLLFIISSYNVIKAEQLTNLSSNKNQFSSLHTFSYFSWDCFLKKSF